MGIERALRFQDSEGCSALGMPSGYRVQESPLVTQSSTKKKAIQITGIKPDKYPLKI